MLDDFGGLEMNCGGQNVSDISLAFQSGAAICTTQSYAPHNYWNFLILISCFATCVMLFVSNKNINAI